MPSREAFERRGRDAMRAVVAAACISVPAVLLLPSVPSEGASLYDPLAPALEARGRIANREATVPSMCYTDVRGGHNPCWTCHTEGQGANSLVDSHLQIEYAFSDQALRNGWANLFVDRSARVAEIADDSILDYVRSDNYGALRDALRERADYPGYVPDLDFDAGFDEDGFARDGSGFRAVRYKPFPGTFWPANGSTDDVFIRLPEAFRSGRDGAPSRAVYKANLSILEAAIGADPRFPDSALERSIEPTPELWAGTDLDGDGIWGVARTIRGLPAHFAGGASGIAVRRYLYPQGTEFLHSVRYLDPGAPGFAARRMKELRYSRKVEALDDWAIAAAYQHEADEKAEGRPPRFRGAADVGLRNAFGWQLQGFIEDAEGRLRLATDQEHQACMGCHSSLGVTVDHTFALARKVPGAGGWRPQDLRGIPDVPQAGHRESEVLTYLRRAGGADEHRANEEAFARFFPDGLLDEGLVEAAAKDVSELLFPSRERALLLDKAYLVIVQSQRFDLGKDPTLTPPAHVLREVMNVATGLGEDKVFFDGRLHLDWSRAGL